MGIASNIISVIVKSVVNSKLGDGLGSELIGISIDEYSAKGIDRIKDFINGEKSKIEHILSEENMKAMDVAEENIDFVIDEIKDLLSEIEITDRVFRECKYSNENLKDFLWNEYCRDKDIIENESDIKKGLYVVAKALIELVRESEEFVKKLLIHINNTVDDIQLEIKNDSSNMMKKLNRLEEGNQAILDKVNENSSILNKDKAQRKIQSRTKDYADKWNVDMFLNDFDEWDEKAGVNVKLKDVYLEKHLPHFIWRDNKYESTNLNVLLSSYVDEDKENKENKMLLILGQPGIGKSTLITWITANFSDKVDSILVYQFANDLNNINWSKSKVFDEILDALVLSFSDLEDKILIFDGFDEINVGENRKEVLDKIYDELTYGKNIKNLSLIITCRENYIKGFEWIKCKYITLQPWDKIQIRSFCSIFHEKTKNEISECTIEKVIEKKDVFGIPLILYMVLALNISIEKDGSIVDVYDKIFSLEGGIYDRCINYKSFAEPHRTGKIKKQIHQISREIAIWMFENNPEEASIPQKEYQKICTDIMQESEKENQNMIQDFKIGGFFKLVRHCEGVETEKLYFVHRTIYEYFVAETIYSSIENAMMELSEKSQEELARNIAFYLKEGVISFVIGEYLQHKVIKLYSKLEYEKKERFYEWWEMSICKMMNVGMLYYTKKNIYSYIRIIELDVQCFENLMTILRLLIDISKKQYVLEEVDSNLCEKYIWYCYIKYYINKDPIYGVVNFSKMFLKKINLSRLDLNGIDLNGANLEGARFRTTSLKNANLECSDLREADLREANLEGADLKRANLERADLRRVNLNEANLKGANLEGANLNNINLYGANLMSTIFDEKQVKYLERWYDLQKIQVVINNTMEVVSYVEYCNRRQRIK